MSSRITEAQLDRIAEDYLAEGSPGGFAAYLRRRALVIGGDLDLELLERIKAARAERSRTYPPGSPDAVAAGCKCPVIDNCYGRGANGYGGTEAEPVYWVTGNCPIHAYPDLGGC